eukprot:gene68-94_t
MSNIFSIPILAFLLGIFATSIHSDLEIPRPISQFITLYLLFCIGFTGGHELTNSVWHIGMLAPISIALLMSILTPLGVFFLSKKRLGIPNAGAIAASYGSVSVVNFIAASAYLSKLHIPYGGHMVALMAFMECPAIIIGMLLIRVYTHANTNYSYTQIIKKVFKSGSILMLLGSLLIGYVSNPAEVPTLTPFITDIQKGMLVFFLLDMGLLVGKNLTGLKQAGIMLFIIGLLVPLLNAAIGIVLTHWLHINAGDSFLLVVLLASASYIAVPAVFRLAVPEANPSIYLAAPLAITFPFNVKPVTIRIGKTNAGNETFLHSSRKDSIDKYCCIHHGKPLQ